MSNTKGVTSKLFILFTIYFSTITGSNQERKLLNDILEHYNVLERPVEKPENNITLYLGLTLLNIINLNEKNSVFQTNLWLTMKWNDFNLKWDPQNYGNITNAKIPPSQIWKPDIFVYNSVDPEFDPSFETKAVIRQDGNITYVSPGIFSTTCKMDFTNYPFDVQKCELKLGSWVFDGSELDLRLQDDFTEGDISSFVKNPQWDLVGMPARRNSIYYACCPDTPYLDVTFVVQLKRRGEILYSLAQLLNALIEITLVLSFLAPLESGHKLSLAILSLVMNAWIVSSLDSPLPEHHTCRLVYYFYFLFLINFAGMVINVITLYLFHKLTSMPDWARTIFVDSIPATPLHFICPSRKISRPGGNTLLIESENAINSTHSPKNAEEQNTIVNSWSYFACMIDRCFFVIFTIVLLIFHGAYFPTIDSMAVQ